jgi:glycerol-3-phosphate dehydrogenase
MTSRKFDAIVIGGGITGAGVLRDLALRGFRALLLERGALGAATTAASSHLIHGGVRYLLYDRLTTHATCWDSGLIARIARPLLTRLPILWPVYRDHRRGLETVETLLESYDPFQRLKGGKIHLRLSAQETRRLVPALKKEGLRGGLLFDEYWVDAVRLVTANVDDARRNGAEVRVGADVVGFERGKDRPTPESGVRVHFSTGEEATFWASVIINASGPWADQVASLAGATLDLRRQKGSHLVYDRCPPMVGNGPLGVGLLLEAVDRERYVFILPGLEKTLVGPTDLNDSEGMSQLKTTGEEIQYLLSSCQRYFPDFPIRFDRTVVGARPILGQRGPEKLLSRGFRVVDHGAEGGPDRLITVAGGKMSDFRLMGEEATDAAARYMGPGGPGRTSDISLDGIPVTDSLRGNPPSPQFKKFLNNHPRLREIHALFFLGAAYARHSARRLFFPERDVSVTEVIAHYQDKT